MKRREGFTIIEVVLFLALSSGLVVALLIGTNTALQQQRYRDAVQSFASFLRGQHERVISVENDRSVDQLCPISSASDSTGLSRGQSKCVILGRYIESQNDYGTKYSTKPVYGLYSDGKWQYALGKIDEEYELNWSAKTRLAGQKDGNSSASVMMYRDPELGTLITRSSEKKYITKNIGDFFVEPTETVSSADDNFNAKEICLYDNSWMLGGRLSIILGARAGSSDTITVSNAGDGCQGV